MTTRPVTSEIAALRGVSEQRMVDDVVGETRRCYETGKDMTADWAMVLVEEIERLREQVPTEGQDPEARRVVRAMVAGLLMQGELANPAVVDPPEKRVKAAVRGTDALLAELDRTEAYEAAR